MRGPDHKIIFLADEMGQFMASDTKDMLNLQIAVLGAECHGRLIVASRPSIVTKNRQRGFLQNGRFDIGYRFLRQCR